MRTLSDLFENDREWSAPLAASPRRLARVWAAAILLAGSVAHADDAPARGVPCFAHRGGIEAGVAENTLAAFRNALALGAHGIELDLRASQDGALVVMHDETVARTTNGRGKTAALTLAALRRLDAGGGERIPTYEEALALVVSADAELLVDVKTRDVDLRELVRITQQHDAVRRVIVGAREGGVLRAVRALAPSLRTLAFVKRPAEADEFVRMGATAIRLWPEWIRSDSALIARTRGLGAAVWTVTGAAPRAEIEPLIALGIDGFLTDSPELCGHRLR